MDVLNYWIPSYSCTVSVCPVFKIFISRNNDSTVIFTCRSLNLFPVIQTQHWAIYTMLASSHREMAARAIVATNRWHLVMMTLTMRWSLCLMIHTYMMDCGRGGSNGCASEYSSRLGAVTDPRLPETDTMNPRRVPIFWRQTSHNFQEIYDVWSWGDRASATRFQRSPPPKKHLPLSKCTTDIYCVSLHTVNLIESEEAMFIGPRTQFKINAGEEILYMFAMTLT